MNWAAEKIVNQKLGKDGVLYFEVAWKNSWLSLDQTLQVCGRQMVDGFHKVHGMGTSPIAAGPLKDVRGFKTSFCSTPTIDRILSSKFGIHTSCHSSNQIASGARTPLQYSQNTSPLQYSQNTPEYLRKDSPLTNSNSRIHSNTHLTLPKQLNLPQMGASHQGTSSVNPNASLTTGGKNKLLNHKDNSNLSMPYKTTSSRQGSLEKVNRYNQKLNISMQTFGNSYSVPNRPVMNATSSNDSMWQKNSKGGTQPMSPHSMYMQKITQGITGHRFPSTGQYPMHQQQFLIQGGRLIPCPPALINAQSPLVPPSNVSPALYTSGQQFSMSTSAPSVPSNKLSEISKKKEAVVNNAPLEGHILRGPPNLVSVSSEIVSAHDTSFDKKKSVMSQPLANCKTNIKSTSVMLNLKDLASPTKHSNVQSPTASSPIVKVMTKNVSLPVKFSSLTSSLQKAIMEKVKSPPKSVQQTFFSPGRDMQCASRFAVAPAATTSHASVYTTSVTVTQSSTAFTSTSCNAYTKVTSSRITTTSTRDSLIKNNKSIDTTVAISPVNNTNSVSASCIVTKPDSCTLVSTSNSILNMAAADITKTSCVSKASDNSQVTAASNADTSSVKNNAPTENKGIFCEYCQKSFFHTRSYLFHAKTYCQRNNKTTNEQASNPSQSQALNSTDTTNKNSIKISSAVSFATTSVSVPNAVDENSKIKETNKSAIELSPPPKIDFHVTSLLDDQLILPITGLEHLLKDDNVFDVPFKDLVSDSFENKIEIANMMSHVPTLENKENDSQSTDQIVSPLKKCDTPTGLETKVKENNGGTGTKLSDNSLEHQNTISNHTVSLTNISDTFEAGEMINKMTGDGVSVPLKKTIEKSDDAMRNSMHTADVYSESLEPEAEELSPTPTIAYDLPEGTPWFEIHNDSLKIHSVLPELSEEQPLLQPESIISDQQESQTQFDTSFTSVGKPEKKTTDNMREAVSGEATVSATVMSESNRSIIIDTVKQLQQSPQATRSFSSSNQPQFQPESELNSSKSKSTTSNCKSKKRKNVIARETTEPLHDMNEYYPSLPKRKRTGSNLFVKDRCKSSDSQNSEKLNIIESKSPVINKLDEEIELVNRDNVKMSIDPSKSCRRSLSKSFGLKTSKKAVRKSLPNAVGPQKRKGKTEDSMTANATTLAKGTDQITATLKDGNMKAKSSSKVSLNKDVSNSLTTKPKYAWLFEENFTLMSSTRKGSEFKSFFPDQSLLKKVSRKSKHGTPHNRSQSESYLGDNTFSNIITNDNFGDLMFDSSAANKELDSAFSDNCGPSTNTLKVTYLKSRSVNDSVSENFMPDNISNIFVSQKVRTQKSFDPLTRSPENFDPLTRSPKRFDPLTRSPENFDPLTRSPENFDPLTRSPKRFTLPPITQIFERIAANDTNNVNKPVSNGLQNTSSDILAQAELRTQELQPSLKKRPITSDIHADKSSPAEHQNNDVNEKRCQDSIIPDTSTMVNEPTSNRLANCGSDIAQKQSVGSKVNDKQLELSSDNVHDNPMNGDASSSVSGSTESNFDDQTIHFVSDNSVYLKVKPYKEVTKSLEKSLKIDKALVNEGQKSQILGTGISTKGEHTVNRKLVNDFTTLDQLSTKFLSEETSKSNPGSCVSEDIVEMNNPSSHASEDMMEMNNAMTSGSHLMLSDVIGSCNEMVTPCCDVLPPSVENSKPQSDVIVPNNDVIVPNQGQEDCELFPEINSLSSFEQVTLQNNDQLPVSDITPNCEGNNMEGLPQDLTSSKQDDLKKQNFFHTGQVMPRKRGRPRKKPLDTNELNSDNLILFGAHPISGGNLPQLKENYGQFAGDCLPTDINLDSVTTQSGEKDTMERKVRVKKYISYTDEPCDSEKLYYSIPETRKISEDAHYDRLISFLRSAYQDQPCKIRALSTLDEINSLVAEKGLKLVENSWHEDTCDE